jgi:hypothetical protein
VGRRSLTVLAFRVFPYLDTAAPGEPGHPLYEHRPQRGGRIDHPDYHVWYVSRHQEAAVGETFGNLTPWRPSMFDFPLLPGARKSLGVYRLPDTLRVLDLDDPSELLKRALRPTQVVARNLAVTQRWGHDIWVEPDPHDATAKRWEAVSWWSPHQPSWSILASWRRPTVESVEPLDLAHPAVAEAAASLLRPLDR